MTQAKEWLFLTFFPQEDINELNHLRANLTPFLKAVSEALSVELEIGTSTDRESVIDRVIRSIPAESSASTFVYPSTQVFNTLDLEFANLLDLRFYFLSFIVKSLF